LLAGIKTKKISFWIKSLIFVIAGTLLVYVLDKNKNLDKLYWVEISKGWKDHSSLLIIAFFLIPVNWSLEAYKWKFLIKKLETISFGRALEGIITGVAMGFVTPHSLGDYVARIFCLTNPYRTKGIGAIFLSRISQFYITLCFGSISVVFYVFKVTREQSELNYDLLFWFTVFNNILFILIFIYHNQLLKYIGHWKFMEKVMPYFGIIKEYSFSEINFVLFLSLLRYMVFCTQFILILICFNIYLDWWLMLMGVGFIFFIKSIIPTFLDFGVREAAAVVFFGAFGYNNQNIIFASLTLWLLNLVLPAIIGLLLVYKVRFLVREKDSY
jgi:hypothetical protein